MLTKNLRLENFKGKKISPKIKIQLKEILNHKNETYALWKKIIKINILKKLFQNLISLRNFA